MPLLHMQFQGQFQQPDGTIIDAPPAAVMVQRGPVLQVVIGLAQSMAAPIAASGGTIPQPVSGLAMLDTGASMTCIDEATAQRLGLPVIDTTIMTSASHSDTMQNVYPIHVAFAGFPVELDIPRAVGALLEPQGIIALIGRDFLAACTLIYSGFTGQITLAL